MYSLIGAVLILVGAGLIFAAQRAGRIFVVRPHEEGVRPQGSRMSLGSDDPEHVIVDPGGLLAPAA